MEKRRLDQYLAERHPQYSRSQIKKLIEEGFFLINGEARKKPSSMIHGGETVELLRRGPELPEAIPQEIPLVILYEDSDIVVINKAAGMCVHPAPGNVQGTLVNALLHYVKDLSGIGGEKRPGIVHRLDKGTSGVMVVAKHDQSHRELSRQFKDREVSKVYEALAFGLFKPKKATVRSVIGRDEVHRRKFSTRTRHGREAVTHYEVVQQMEGWAHLRIQIETGRTHQIRVHLSENHHPIMGDTLYGAKSFLSMITSETFRNYLENISRPLLHAKELSFTHPMSKKKMHFVTPLPDDFLNALSAI